MLEVLFVIGLVIWLVCGTLMGETLYMKQKVLPADNPYKNIVGLIACGPFIWLVRICVYISNNLRMWLRK